MISAERFLELLEARDLLSKKNADKLRAQIAQASKPVSAESVARLLIKKGYLTAPLAKRLLGLAAAAGRPEAGEQTQADSPGPRGGARGGEPEEELILLEEPEPGKREDEGEELILLDDEAPAAPAAEEEAGLLDELRAASARTDETLAPLQPPAEEDEEELELAPLDEPKRTPAGPAAAPPQPPEEPVPRAEPLEEAAATAQPPPGTSEGASAPPGGSLWDEAGSEIPPAALAPLAASLEQPPATPAGPLAAPTRRRPFRRRKRAVPEEGKSIWDTKLILIGGGALLGLLILLGILIWAFTRESGDEMFAIADEFYRQGSYTKAIENFDRYLEKAPNHPQVGLARVRRGLARIRQITETKKDWAEALAVAQEVLPEIAQEKEFAGEGRPDLRSLLPQIAQGLAEQAHENLDPSLVEKSREAIALIEKYIPSSQRPRTQMEEIQALLALTERQIAQGAELEKAVAAMNKATEAGDATRAYAIRAALLEQYPALANDEKLMAATLAISDSLRSAVRRVERSLAAETVEPPAGPARATALAQRTWKADAPGAKGHVIFALAEQAAYGLDAETGKLLWRRPVGFTTDGQSLRFPPTPVSSAPASDAVLVDHARQELLRVEATTGKVRWRLPVGEPFDAHPVVTEDRIWLATRQGKLMIIDPESGNCQGYTQLPQQLRVGPTLDLARGKVYQLADHSNLYVLSLADGSGQDVVYLGHERGTVRTPPVVFSRFLLVAENDRAEESRLRIFSLEPQKDKPPFHPLQEVRVRGHVDTPPVVSGLLLLVATDVGEVYVYRISAAEKGGPLTEVATGKAGEQEGQGPGAGMLVRYPLIRQGQAWVADSQLTRFDIHAARGRLQPRGVDNDRSATLQPLVAVGQTLFHVRRKRGLPGVAVSAVAMKGGVLWETHLAAPLATEPIVRDHQLTLVNRLGAIFEIHADRLAEQTVLDEPTLALQAADVRRELTWAVPLSYGAVAVPTAGNTPRIAVFDPAESRQRFLWILLADPLSCAPVEGLGGLLAPCRSGQVYLMDPKTGDKLAEPFQPPMEPGSVIAWKRPALVGERQFLLADGRHKLYLVGLKQGSPPFLDAVASLDTTDAIVSPPAVTGNLAYVVDAANMVLAIRLPQLEVTRRIPLGGGCAWGPERVDENHVLVATDDLQLYCLGQRGETVWQIPLPYGPLAGRPLAVEDAYILTSTRGVVWRVDGKTGEETGKVEIGQALGTGAVRVGNDLIVGGYDGTLYRFAMP